jgi:hypothetical protein
MFRVRLNNLWRLSTVVVAALSTVAAGGCTPSSSAGIQEGILQVTIDDASEPSNLVRTREDYLSEWARMLQIDNPPIVEVIKEVWPEQVRDLVDLCLEDVGFPATSPGSWNFSTDQREAFNLAAYICYASFPVKVEANQLITESQKAFIREYWAATWIPCAVEQGFVITPPPSTETVLSNWGTSNAWWPSNELGALGVTGSNLEAVLRICPEMPPTAEMIRH